MALQRDHICFAVLLLCVPFQYFFVNYMGSTETARNYGISKMVNAFHTFSLELNCHIRTPLL